MSREEKKSLARRPLPEWLAVRLDIPSDLGTGMRLEMRGRNSLIVHGCRRILDYGPAEIRLDLGQCALSVRGERLLCTSYLAGAVGIDGHINALICEEVEE